MRKVSVIIEDREIDLFNDEDIIVKSSVQNLI